MLTPEDYNEPAILGYVRITPVTNQKSVDTETGEIIKQACCPGWIYSPSKQYLRAMNCKRRNCEECGWYWGYKWRQALAAKAEYDKDLKVKYKADKALGLTFAENLPFKNVQRCLEYFWDLLRRGYPGVQYWGVVEFNQSHTLPHLHFVLCRVPYIEIDYIDYCWQKAQKWAGYKKIAWNVRIEKIQKNIQAYFTKYVTKLIDGGKDEVPRRENWGGRFVRYSLGRNGKPGFFPIPVSAMLAGRRWCKEILEESELDKVYSHVRKPMAGLSGFMEKSDKENQKIFNIINSKWEPLHDQGRGSPIDKPQITFTIDYTGSQTTFKIS